MLSPLFDPIGSERLTLADPVKTRAHVQRAVREIAAEDAVTDEAFDGSLAQHESDSWIDVLKQHSWPLPSNVTTTVCVARASGAALLLEASLQEDAVRHVTSRLNKFGGTKSLDVVAVRAFAAWFASFMVRCLLALLPTPVHFSRQLSDRFPRVHTAL